MAGGAVKAYCLRDAPVLRYARTRLRPLRRRLRASWLQDFAVNRKLYSLSNIYDVSKL